MQAEWCARKLLGVRLFDSADGSKPWARSVAQANLDVLLISQFTLFATLKGNKPDFHRAMGPTTAKPFWEAFVQRVRKAHTSGKVAEGTFGAKMAVRLCNDGPVTIELESPSSSSSPAPQSSGPPAAAATAARPPAAAGTSAASAALPAVSAAVAIGNPAAADQRVQLSIQLL